jgi:hypothetical protein
VQVKKCKITKIPRPVMVALLIWWSLSPLLLSLQPAHSDVPYFGILRGWENRELGREALEQIVGYDIAADGSGIYIAGEYFGRRLPGFGPMVMFLNPDHIFRCQNILRFRVDDSRGVPRSGAYSIALTDDSVIVAGVYGEWGGSGHVARLFIAVFNKEDCRLTGIKELIDGSLQWENEYPSYVSGVKVVWDQARSSMFVMLQTRETGTFVPHLYIIQLDTQLDILNAVRYDLVSFDNFYVSDMFDGDSTLYVTGTYIDKDGNSHILYGEISKDNFIAFWYYFPSLSFPRYDVRVEEFLPLSRIVLTFGDVGGWTYVNIAFTMACSGLDCSEDGRLAYRLGILRFPLGFRQPPVEVRLYNFTTTHWNTPAPYNHDNNTWVTRVVEAGGVLYIVGFLNMDPNWLIYDEKSGSYSLATDLDGFVYAVDSRTLDAQYMLRVVSLDGAPSDGGRRVLSAVLGAGSYKGYVYITGTAGNYYLEFTPFNPSNITGTATRDTFTLKTGSHRLTELLPPNFQGDVPNIPVFDQDAHPSTAGFYGVLRLKPATTTTSTTTSTVTKTTTSTTTRTVTSTPTTTVTRFTTSTQTAVATVVQTEYVFSTVYTTRVVEGTVTRVETVTSVTTIPYVTTLTDTTTVRSVVTATTTPTVYATVQTTVLRNMTTYLTTTKTVQPPDMVPWWYVPVSLTPLSLIPLMAAMFRGGLKIIILDEDFRPSVGRVRRGKWVTYINKDKEVHTLEFYNQQEPDQVRTLTIDPGKNGRIRFKAKGRYFFRLQVNPKKIGILEVE